MWSGMEGLRPALELAGVEAPMGEARLTAGERLASTARRGESRGGGGPLARGRDGAATPPPDSAMPLRSLSPPSAFGMSQSF